MKTHFRFLNFSLAVLLFSTQTAWSASEMIVPREAVTYTQSVAPSSNSGLNVQVPMAKQTPSSVDFLTQSQTLSAVKDIEVQKSPAQKGVPISNLADLRKIEKNMSGNYYLTRDIDAAAAENSNGGAGFDPIGSQELQFLGKLDGNGFTIKNLTINRPDEGFVGLFAALGESAEVKNLKMKDVSITGSSNVGALAGYMFLGSVHNISVEKGSVHGSSQVGGLIGEIYNGKGVYESHTDVTVIGFDQVGGIVGKIWDGVGNDVIQSYALGNVLGRSMVGGLAGYSKSGDMIQSYAKGSVNGQDMVGGLVGFTTENAGIHDSYYAGGIVSGYSFVGGISGFYDSYDDGISRTYFAGSVASAGGAGGFLGLYQSGTLADNYWDTTLNPGLQDTWSHGDMAGITGLNTKALQKQSTYENWDFRNVWVLKGGYPQLRHVKIKPAAKKIKNLSVYRTILSETRTAVETKITEIQYQLSRVSGNASSRALLNQQLAEAQTQLSVIRQLMR